MKNNTMIPYNVKKDLETNYYNKTEVELLLAAGSGSGGSIDLSNYYKKLETYSKAQVDAMISSGTTDLSNYYTRAQVESLISAIPATDLTNYYDKTQVDSLIPNISTKQDTLVSATNIKTINGQSVLGSGNIVIIDEGSVQLTGNQTIAGIKTFSSDIVGNITGNAATATKLATARTITLSGDVSGNVDFDGSTNVTMTTTIQPDSVVLGTDTTGAYVVGNTAGTGITISGTAGEGWSPTIAITDVGTAGTYTKVTTNAQGQVTAGATLSSTDIPELDASKITSGVIDAARLPSYVDDVLEFSSLGDFPLEGETGKIYVAIDTNKTYRWGVTSYVYINSGAVDSVAGKTGVVTLNKDDVGLNQVDNTSDVDKPISTATANALALKTDTATLESLNTFRADKVLASKDVANLIYSDGNLVKIRYTINDDVDYEVLTYSGEDLTNVAHYLGGVLQGNTVLTYSGGNLVSSIFVGV